MFDILNEIKLFLKDLAAFFKVEILESTPIKEALQKMRNLMKVPYIPYPVALHPTDIIPIREASFLDGKAQYEILLGRKKGKTRFQTIGGFVDPGESAEFAAARELKEEANLFIRYHLIYDRNLNSPGLFYLGSFFVDDERYVNSPHKVSTSLYATSMNFNDTIHAKAGDDIEEIKWFALEYVVENGKEFITKNHFPLVEAMYKTLFNKTQS